MRRRRDGAAHQPQHEHPCPPPDHVVQAVPGGHVGPGRGRDLSKIVLTLLLLGSCATPEAGRAPTEHVVIVSIDGLRPEFYLDNYEAPTLQAMAASGACARAVESVYPSSTYPAHATIVTGVLPARHGIYANTTWTDQGSTRDWYWFAKALKARTI